MPIPKKEYVALLRNHIGDDPKPKTYWSTVYRIGGGWFTSETSQNIDKGRIIIIFRLPLEKDIDWRSDHLTLDRVKGT